MLNDFMGMFQETQKQMEETKKQLNDKFVEAEVENGLVKVTANGNKRITNLTISPDVLNDKDALEDLIITAVNKVMEKSEQLFDTEMQKIAGVMLPNLNGLF